MVLIFILPWFFWLSIGKSISTVTPKIRHKPFEELGGSNQGHGLVLPSVTHQGGISTIMFLFGTKYCSWIGFSMSYLVPSKFISRGPNDVKLPQVMAKWYKLPMESTRFLIQLPILTLLTRGLIMLVSEEGGCSSTCS